MVSILFSGCFVCFCFFEAFSQAQYNLVSQTPKNESLNNSFQAELQNTYQVKLANYVQLLVQNYRVSLGLSSNQNIPIDVAREIVSKRNTIEDFLSSQYHLDTSTLRKFESRFDFDGDKYRPRKLDSTPKNESLNNSFQAELQNTYQVKLANYVQLLVQNYRVSLGLSSNQNIPIDVAREIVSKKNTIEDFLSSQYHLDTSTLREFKSRFDFDADEHRPLSPKEVLRSGIQVTQDEIRMNLAQALEEDVNLRVTIKQIGNDGFFTPACDFTVPIHSGITDAQYSVPEKCTEIDFTQGGRLNYRIFLNNEAQYFTQGSVLIK